MNTVLKAKNGRVVKMQTKNLWIMRSFPREGDITRICLPGF